MTEEKLKKGHQMLNAIQDLERSINDYEKGGRGIVVKSQCSNTVHELLTECNDGLVKLIISAMKNKLKTLKSEFANL